MLTIYKTAFGFIGRNPAFSADIALMMLVISVAVEFLNISRGPGTVVWLFIVYLLLRAMMFDEVSLLKKVESPRRPVALGRFFLAGLLFLAGLIVLGLITLFAVFGDALADATNDDVTMLAALASISVVFAVLMSAFGTALPAAAAADRWGPAISLMRAGRTWWRILGGLLIGPGLYAVIGIAAMMAFDIYGPGILPYFGPDGTVDLLQLLIGFVINLGTLLHTLLTVTVLILAYQRVAPVEVQAAMGHFEQKSEVFA